MVTAAVFFSIIFSIFSCEPLKGDRRVERATETLLLGVGVKNDGASSGGQGRGTNRRLMVRQ